VEGVMRGGNYDARGEIILPHQAGHARSSDYSGGKERDAIIGKSSGELSAM
jgi:hypothetical protein